MRVTLKETNQLVEQIFPFVRKIPDIPEMTIDELRETQGSIAFLAEGIDIVSQNVVGGYSANFNFSIYYRVSAKDTKSKFEATRVLNYISDYLYQVSIEKKMPNLKGSDTAQRFEMTSNPQLMQSEENSNAVYIASFAMRYTHKANIF